MCTNNAHNKICVGAPSPNQAPKSRNAKQAPQEPESEKLNCFKMGPAHCEPRSWWLHKIFAPSVWKLPKHKSGKPPLTTGLGGLCRQTTPLHATGVAPEKARERSSKEVNETAHANSADHPPLKSPIRVGYGGGRLVLPALTIKHIDESKRLSRARQMIRQMI